MLVPIQHGNACLFGWPLKIKEKNDDKEKKNRNILKKIELFVNVCNSETSKKCNLKGRETKESLEKTTFGSFLQT